MLEKIGIVRGLVGAAFATATIIGTYFFAVDSSYDVLTYEEAVRLKEQGVELYIQALTALPPSGLEHPDSRIESLENADRAGLKIAGYALLSPSQDRTPTWQMDFARSDIPNRIWNKLEFVAVDVEVPGITIEMVREACSRLRTLGKAPCVIYTNYSSWVSFLGNPTRDDGWLLWNAYWDNDPDIDFRFLPFGGWQEDEILCEQYSGGTYVAGQFVDQNQCQVPPAPQPGVVIPTWKKAEPNWRWFMPDGFSYDIKTKIWYNPDGKREWGACKSWGGRYNYYLDAYMHSGHGFYDHSRDYWSTAPAC